jgi:hypothetical protein
MPENKQIQARVLESVRVLHSDKPDVAVVEIQVKGGKSAHLAMSRKAMLEVAHHLQKHAQAKANGAPPQVRRAAQ